MERGGRRRNNAQAELHASRILLPPPLAAEVGFTRVRPLIKRPKSDKSDFGWRDGEGAAASSEQAERTPSLTLPRKRAIVFTHLLESYQWLASARIWIFPNTFARLAFRWSLCWPS